MSESAIATPAQRPAKHGIFLLALLLVAAALRFYRLDGSSLWSDEGNTWALLSRSFAQIAQDAAADIHPPGYYWLLKLWTLVVGTSAWGMRSFSAVAGVLLVYCIYRLGRTLEVDHKQAGVALLATLLAALNPLQIYYSQEARMYLLLAVESAGLFWALLTWQRRAGRHPSLPALGYLLCGVAGLWTHYSFPVIWAAACLGFVVNFMVTKRQTTTPARSPSPPEHLLLSQRRTFWLFVVLNGLILLAYLPWLPIAVERVLHWPKGGETVTLATGVTRTVQTFVFGPLRDLPALQQPWLWGAALLPLIGLFGQWRQAKVWIVGLWCLAPLLLMVGLGLFSEAFLKFLLTASPAWCLLTALGIHHLPRQRLWTPLFAGAALALAAVTLPTYYTSPTARDNYAGIARYLAATADPAQTLVVLDAPGQQEVWHYYNPALPTVALPQQRPPDNRATTAALQAAITGRTAIYALFWATAEADPEQVVERWLDQHAFKGLDRWQGNLRFVTYSLPTTLHCSPIAPATIFGATIQLTELCQPSTPQQVAAGEVALIGLQWQALAPLSQRYKVTVQMLNSQNELIAQRDSEPVGGSLPTDQWVAGERVVDNHGLLIPPGTPPGPYRLIVALYDVSTGERLQLNPTTDYFVLGALTVVRPEQPLPTSLLPLQQRVNRRLGPLQFLGYTMHRKEMAHAPETPIVAGDRVEFTFFWQAPTPLPPTWPAALSITLTLGDQSLSQPIAGAAYPTEQWQAGELVQSKAEMVYTGGSPIPRLQIGDDTIRLHALPGAAWWHMFN